MKINVIIVCLFMKKSFNNDKLATCYDFGSDFYSFVFL